MSGKNNTTPSPGRAVPVIRKSAPRLFAWFSFINFSVLFLIFPTAVSVRVFGQALLLPLPPTVVSGNNNCADLRMMISSESWRVRKGDKVEFRAIQPFGELSGLTDSEISQLSYSWAVTNGKIISGQGTPLILVKAGAQRTPGYINLTGFVTVNLFVSGQVNGAPCSLNASTNLMVGRHREWDGFANVDDVTLDKTQLTRPCISAQTPTNRTPADTMTVNVVTKASDPEYGVLSYVYLVSVGKIVGSGPNVVWDLTGVPAGEYYLYSGVDDGFGIRGKTKKATLTVVECATSVRPQTFENLKKIR